MRNALLTQLAGALMAAALLWLTRPFFNITLFEFAIVQGFSAAFVSWRVGAPPWWRVIHLLFMPLVLLALALDIAPGWYLAAFVLSLLVFWRTDRSRVPLYLSNKATADTVAALLPEGAARVIDLGCGDGRLLRHLSLARPDCIFVGYEHAPLPWLVARLTNLHRRNVDIRYGDFWQHPLGPYDVVYAFLSPAPMPALADKCQAEMAPGKHLISNSFPIPDEPAAQTIVVDDRRQSHLFCYKIGLRNPAKPQS